MLTEKSILEIEKATGLKGLQEIIASQEPVDIVPKYTIHMNQISYDTMLENIKDNIPPEKYAEIKTAGEEMAIKAIKKAKGFEFEGKTAQALMEFLEKKIETSKSEDINKIKSEFENDIAELKKAIQKEKTEKEQILQSVESDRINYEINKHFDSLQIEVPIHIKDEKEIERFVKLEREKNKNYFKSLYQFKTDENKRILPMKDGQILKDEVLNPITVDKLIEGYISDNFVSLKKTHGGRGEGDKLPGINIPQMKSLDELDSFAKSKGIVKGSEAYDALYIEFNKK